MLETVSFALSVAFFIYQEGHSYLNGEKTNLKNKNDEFILDYLEWLRRQDQNNLISLINSRYDELYEKITLGSENLAVCINQLQALLQNGHAELNAKLKALEKSIVPSVFSNIPVNYRSLFIQPKLIGRENELQELLQMNGDIIISGQPGSGKTFLLYHFCQHKKGKFLTTDNSELIRRNLLIHNPPVIIVDDAASRFETIETLRHFRRENNRDFCIIAICWSHEDDIIKERMELSKESVFKLKLLEQKAIAEITKAYLKNCSVSANKDVIRIIRRQAGGRPGLAIALAKIMVDKNDLRAAWNNDAYMGLLKPYIKNNENILPLLALFAVGGDAGIAKDSVAASLGISIHELTCKLQALASGGIIHVNHSSIAVQPSAFRIGLIREYFFQKNALSLEDEYWKLYHQVPNKSAAWENLIVAIATGAEPSYNRIIECVQNDYEKWKLLAGSNSCWANIAYKKFEDNPSIIKDFTLPLLYIIPDKAIPLALDLLESNEKLIFDDLKSWLNDPPNIQEIVSKRKLLFSVSHEKAISSKNTDILLSILPLCLGLELQFSEVSSDSDYEFVFSSGTIRIEDARCLAQIWDDTILFFETRHIQNWNKLLNVVFSWSNAFFAKKGLISFTRQKIKKVINALIRHPDAPARAIMQAAVERNLYPENKLNINDDYYTIYPLHKRKMDWQSEQEINSTKIKDLALRWQLKSPDEFADFLKICSQEHEAFQCGSGNYDAILCWELARIVIDVNAWLNAMVKNNLASKFIHPFLHEAVIVRHVTESAEWIKRCITYVQYQECCLGLILQNEEYREMLNGRWHLIDEHRKMTESLAYNGKIGMSYFPLLKNCAAQTQIGILIDDWREAKKLYATNRHLWLKMFKNSINELVEWNNELGHHFYDIENLIAEIPEIKFDIALSVVKCRRVLSDHEEDKYRIIFEQLSPSQKIEILRQGESIQYTGLPAMIIADDITAFALLIADKSLEHYHLSPLENGFKTSYWRAKAVMALDSGYSPEDIAEKILGCHFSWQGDGTVYWKKWVNDFSILLSENDKKLQEVGQHGVEMAQSQLKFYQKRADDERIWGR